MRRFFNWLKAQLVPRKSKKKTLIFLGMKLANNGSIIRSRK